MLTFTAQITPSVIWPSLSWSEATIAGVTHWRGTYKARVTDPNTLNLVGAPEVIDVQITVEMWKHIGWHVHYRGMPPAHSASWASVVSHDPRVRLPATYLSAPARWGDCAAPELYALGAVLARNARLFARDIDPWQPPGEARFVLGHEIHIPMNAAYAAALNEFAKVLAPG